jgi:hypothetical protein
MAAQLSDPLEYVTGDTGRGGLDEKGMAYLGRIQAYQRIRAVILRDAWLIDHDHKEDEGGGDVEPDEEASDAAPTAEQNSRPHQSEKKKPRTTTTAVVTTLPSRARHQRRTSGVDDSNATGTAKPRLATPDAVG